MKQVSVGIVRWRCHERINAVLTLQSPVYHRNICCFFKVREQLEFQASFPVRSEAEITFVRFSRRVCAGRAFYECMVINERLLIFFMTVHFNRISHII